MSDHIMDDNDVKKEIPLSEAVCRVLFFAKYEANVERAKNINLHHLLAGFLRETKHRLTIKLP